MNNFEEIENIKKKLKLIDSIKNYKYEISPGFGKITINNNPVLYEDFFYIYDNGDPSLRLLPQNLTTKFHYWFLNDLTERIENRLYELIFNKNDPNEYDVVDCMESFYSVIKDWIKSFINSHKIIIKYEVEGEEVTETLNLVNFSNSFDCKLIKIT